jgi:aryl-alcohol dehydrogenase-like predicted oxidoreductase
VPPVIATPIKIFREGLGASPASVALAWATRQPGVAAVIIGPRTLGQLQDNLAGFSISLPPDVLTRLSEIAGPLHAEPGTGMGAHRLPGTRPPVRWGTRPVPAANDA